MRYWEVLEGPQRVRNKKTGTKNIPTQKSGGCKLLAESLLWRIIVGGASFIWHYPTVKSYFLVSVVVLFVLLPRQSPPALASDQIASSRYRRDLRWSMS